MPKTSKKGITKILRFQLKKIIKIFSFQLDGSLDHPRFFLELSILFLESSSFVRRYIVVKLLTSTLSFLPLIYQRRNRSANNETITI